MTKRILFSLFALTLLWISLISVSAQQASEQSNIVKVSLGQSEIDNIINRLAAKEAEFQNALREYSFRRDATVQSIGFGGQVSGEFRRDSIFVFNSDGTRYEKILFAPVPTLKEFNLTAEDIQDLNGVKLFALEPSKIAQYKLTFLGKEKIDELNLFVFDVEPKVMPDPKKTKERMFQGRIWVDDVDLQIVKSKGKGVPEWKNNKFPIVETWRENIDGKYWFPSYSYGNGELVFDSGSIVRYKVKINFKNYAKAKTDVRILDDDTEVIEEPEQPKKP